MGGEEEKLNGKSRDKDRDSGETLRESIVAAPRAILERHKRKDPALSKKPASHACAET